MPPPAVTLEDHPDGVIISILVVPGASRSEIVGPHGDMLRLRVAAPPERGRANGEAATLLETFFGVPATLLTGATWRRKRFLLEGINKGEVVALTTGTWG